MSKLDVRIPHQLAQDDALSRIKTLMSSLKEEHKSMISELSEEWDNYTGTFHLTAKGFSADGTIEVEKDAVQINGKLPLMLSFFQGAITDMIRKKATEVLVKAG